MSENLVENTENIEIENAEVEEEIAGEESAEEELAEKEEAGEVSVKEIDYNKLETAIEAILFTMGDSVELEKLAAALEIEKKEAKKLVTALMERYEAEERGMKIIELDGAYQMCTRDTMYEYLIKIAKQPKKYVLTDVLLETMAIIAYKQPVTKAEIEKIRGVSCDHSVNKLMEYNLVKEVGRLNVPGRPILLGTTEEFLRSFGLKGLDDLPEFNSDMVNEFKSQAEQEVQLRLDV